MMMPLATRKLQQVLHLMQTINSIKVQRQLYKTSIFATNIYFSYLILIQINYRSLVQHSGYL